MTRLADTYGVDAIVKKGRESEKHGPQVALAATAAAAAFGAAVLHAMPADMAVTVPPAVWPLGVASGAVAAGIGARRLWTEVGSRLVWRMPRKRPAHAGAIPVCLGFSTATGRFETVSLEALPHLMIAGQTRAGKSSFERQVLSGIVLWTRPAEARVVIIDCKGGVEFAWMAKAPHVRQVATDEDEAVAVLAEVEAAVEDRLAAMRRAGVVDCREVAGLGRVVVVVDELAELQESKEAMRSLRRIAARGGAAGVHLILATQRPDKDALPGPIKANIPAGVCFRVKNRTNSEIVLDKGGAEDLPPKGTAIWQWVREYVVRTPWVSHAEAQEIVAAAIERASQERQQVPALGGRTR